ncbi:MAG: hypothetical protein KY459_07040 [Acidobacteria bacterium]|nr:hypothetical protein [Acidobacteriota bacterium]
MDTKEFEKFMRDVFGESVDKVKHFRDDQVKRVEGKLHELARDAVADEISTLRTKIEALEHKIATLETKLERIGNS